MLNSTVLGLHSSYFKATLSERWSSQSQGNVNSGATIKWHYQLLFDNEKDDDGGSDYDVSEDMGITTLSRVVS